MSPIAGLLQRVSGGGNLINNQHDIDLVNSAAEELAKPDAALPCSAEDLYIYLMDHIISHVLANGEVCSDDAGIPTKLLKAATSLLTLHCTPVLQLPPSAAEEAATRQRASLIVEVVEASAGDQLPAKTLLAVAATAPLDEKRTNTHQVCVLCAC